MLIPFLRTKKKLFMLETTDFIKTRAKKQDALDDGICKMKPYP